MSLGTFGIFRSKIFFAINADQILWNLVLPETQLDFIQLLHDFRWNQWDWNCRHFTTFDLLDDNCLLITIATLYPNIILHFLVRGLQERNTVFVFRRDRDWKICEIVLNLSIRYKWSLTMFTVHFSMHSLHVLLDVCNSVQSYSYLHMLEKCQIFLFPSFLYIYMYLRSKHNSCISWSLFLTFQCI